MLSGILSLSDNGDQRDQVTVRNDLLNRNIFQVVNFKWNIGAEFVSLTKITGCIVAHCIDLIRVV